MPDQGCQTRASTPGYTANELVAMEQRPSAVPIVAAFLFAASAVSVIVGISLLFRNPLLDRIWQLNKPAEASFRALGWIAAALLLALGAGTSAAAMGLLRRRQWAWWFAVALFAVNGSGDVVSFVATRDWLRSASGVAIACAFVYCLSRPGVRRYFRV